MCSRKCWIVSFFYFFLHLPHRQFSFIDLCLSSKMYWTFNCSWDNVMKWNVFFFCVLHIFQNFPCTLGEKSKSVSFLRVYVCVKAKLTLVSFFTFFHAPSPKGLGWLRGLSGLISLLYIYCHMVRTPLGIGRSASQTHWQIRTAGRNRTAKACSSAASIATRRRTARSREATWSGNREDE